MRALYEWEKKPVPESTRPHNFRKREDPKRYAELRKKVLDFRREQESWGRSKIQYLMTVANHSISVAMVGRMLSEFIQDALIKSYFGTCANLAALRPYRRALMPRNALSVQYRPHVKKMIYYHYTVIPNGKNSYGYLQPTCIPHINRIADFENFGFLMVFGDDIPHFVSQTV